MPSVKRWGLLFFCLIALAFGSTIVQNVMTTLGDIIYGGANGSPTRLAGNTTVTQKFLSQTGDGVNSAAPSWQPLPSTSGFVPYTGATADLNLGVHSITVTSCTGCGAAQLHSISFVIDGGGSVIATGDAKVYPTADFACTINRWDISADQAGDIAVSVSKAVGAIPTGANKISASVPIEIAATNQLAQNGSVATWSPVAVSVGDVFGFSVDSAHTVTRVVGQIWCQ